MTERVMETLNGRNDGGFKAPGVDAVTHAIHKNAQDAAPPATAATLTSQERKTLVERWGDVSTRTQRALCTWEDGLRVEWECSIRARVAVHPRPRRCEDSARVSLTESGREKRLECKKEKRGSELIRVGGDVLRVGQRRRSERQGGALDIPWGCEVLECESEMT